MKGSFRRGGVLIMKTRQGGKLSVPLNPPQWSLMAMLIQEAQNTIDGDNSPKYLSMEILQVSLSSTGRMLGSAESVRTIVYRLRAAIITALQAWVEQGICHDAKEAPRL